MIIKELEKKKLIHPPRWLSTNTHYLTMMGSVAYGVSGDTSDMDIYGFCIPPKNDIFPHLKGEIPGFGKQIQRFDQWQEQHIKDPSAMGGSGREYDFSVYSIVKYFQLCMENNPNMIDSLFTPQNCVLYTSATANLVRDNRHIFLHKGCWPKFKGYAYSQLTKIKEKTRVQVREFEEAHGIASTNYLGERLKELNDYVNMVKVPDWAVYDEKGVGFIHQTVSKYDRDEAGVMVETKIPLHEIYRNLLIEGDKHPEGKRKELVEKYGYDTKFAYHIIRLLLEVEQILGTGTIDLQQGREQMKSIRRGEWPEQEVRDWFQAKQADLETLYKKSELPWGPDEAKIKALLVQCLEAHYGSLEDAVSLPDRPIEALREIQTILDTMQGQI